MTDYERARFISENSLVYIDRGRWRLVESARKYVAAENLRRQSCCRITRESYEAWQALVSEIGS